VGERDKLIDQLDTALVDVLKQQSWLPDAETLTVVKRRPTRDLYAFTLYGRALNLFYGFSGPVDLGGAQKLLGKVLLIDPKFAEAHRMLGVVHLARGEHGKAAGQYLYALDLRPGYYAPLVGLAHLYRAENRRQQALEMAEKALEARPGDVEMRFLVGDLEWEAGDLDKSLADLLVVTAAQPGHLRACRTLALVYAARGDTPALAVELERIAGLAPDDLDVKLDLGSAYMRMGKNEQALASYEEVLKKQPKNVQALKFTGDLYRRVGESERAIAAYEKVRHLSHDDPRPFFLLGAAYAEAGNDTKAEAVLQEAQEFRSHLGEAWTDLGAIALRRGDLSKATWYLERAVLRAPNRPKAHFNYALLLNATKQRDRALAELKTTADLDPDDAECHYLAGVIYLRLGRLDEAKEEFAAAVKRKPDHPDARHNLALLEDLERRYGSERSGVGAQ
jgi:tetratricopeptide (TPR) repeat protein